MHRASTSSRGEAATFFVTGGTGYLGSRLVRHLLGLGCMPVVLKRSYSDTRRIADLLPAITCIDLDSRPINAVFDDHECACVVHCATDYGRTSVSPAALVESNVVFPLRLFEAAADRGVPVFVNTDTVLDRQTSPYALSKAQFRDWFTDGTTTVQRVNVAIEHFYGPGDDTTKFVTSVLLRMLGGVSRIPLTPGAQLRDFIYIDDVVSAFERILARHVPAMSHRDPAEARDSSPMTSYYCVGSGDPVTIHDLMTLMRRLASREDIVLDFGAIPYRPHETMKSLVGLGALEALGWRPRIGLREGLTRTIHEERVRMARSAS